MNLLRMHISENGNDNLLHLVVAFKCRMHKSFRIGLNNLFFSTSQNFRQSASMAVTEYQLNERNRQFWPPANIGYRATTPEIVPATSPSVRTNSLVNVANGAESPPLTSGDFLLPSKRQRLFRHSYSASSNLNP